MLLDLVDWTHPGSRLSLIIAANGSKWGQLDVAQSGDNLVAIQELEGMGAPALVLSRDSSRPVDKGSLLPTK